MFEYIKSVARASLNIGNEQFIWIFMPNAEAKKPAEATGMRKNVEEQSVAWSIKTSKGEEHPGKGGVETLAGIVRLVREEHPVRDIIRKSWGKDETYNVYLEQPGLQEKRIGYVVFAYRKVGNISIENGSMYTALIENKLNEEDSVVHLETFRPFYYVSEREAGDLGRKGIGTAVLAQVLEKSESRGVVGASCFTKEEKMQNLLEKSGFQKIGENAYYNALVPEPKQS
ncbi:hypothetical protein H0N98_03605 [Candidatus Micrarchaeota archaeon]|nr:hypothetical protein [Candidatus Micrarchaeota archaeon]